CSVVVGENYSIKCDATKCTIEDKNRGIIKTVTGSRCEELAKAVQKAQ
nr:Chain A, S4_2.45 [Human respiratory syncytial virus A2]